MTSLLLRAAVFLGSAAIGLLAAAWLVHGVRVSVWGFVGAVVILSKRPDFTSDVVRRGERVASAR